MRKLFLVFIFVLQTSYGHAADIERVHNLMTLAGAPEGAEIFIKEIESIPNNIPEMTRLERRSWARASTVFSVDGYLKTVAEYTASTLNEDYFAPSEAFFTSEIGQTIVAAEIANAANSNPEKIMRSAFIMETELAETDPQRQDVLMQLMEDGQIVDYLVTMQANVSFAIGAAMLAGSDNPFAMTEGQLLLQISKSLPEIRKMSYQMALGLTYQTYGKLPIETIIAYSNYLQSEAGKSVQNVLYAGTQEYLKTSFGTLGRNMLAEAKGKDI